MSDFAIRCENLSKRYRIGSPERYKTLRDAISNTALAPFHRFRNNSQNGHGYIWALQDVCCEIKRGEVVGIIGLNGAGKSTLLKILSRITGPTRGRADIYGRVGSLLEVGTGFHPELTGRENIYLNGSILGMKKTEIDRKFDEIVAFAEVEKFLDTPVKHYSSGMYVRLAFAVAAHLEPEILIVDEVLAVGDVAFQKKCLGRMQEVSRHDGRTILFVSHNLHAVRRLCSKALFLSQGKAEYFGSVPHAIDRYCAMSGGAVEPLPRPTSDLLNQAFFTGFSLETKNGPAPPVLPIGAYWQARVQFTVGRKMDEFVIGLGVVANDGTPVQTAWSERMRVQPGSYQALFSQDNVVLAAGSYDLLVGISQRG